MWQKKSDTVIKGKAGYMAMTDPFFEMVKTWTVYDYNTPGIKAEVIIDMLISEFVCDIVKQGKGLKENPVFLAKEFPVLTFSGDKAPYTLREEPKKKTRLSSRNAKVDFLLAYIPEKYEGVEKNILFFVELKTSKESFDDKQLIRMLYSAELGVDACISYYEQVKRDSDQQEKYNDQYNGIISELRKKGLDFTEESFSEIECLYLSLGNLDGRKKTVNSGGKLVLNDDKGNELFVIDGYDMKKDKEGRQCIDIGGRIRRKIRGEILGEKKVSYSIPIIDLKKHVPQRDNELWNKVKDIINKLNNE